MQSGERRAMATRGWLFAALSMWVLPCSAQVGPQPVHGAHGMVASAEGRATEVGVAILKRGGNAVDAAVAVGMALAVTCPVAGNLGGGGFMLVRMASGEAIAIDYREVAPQLATRNMYLDPKGDLIPDASLVGSKAAGVPGTVAGLALAQQKYGKLSWREVLEPARLLAAHGFPLSYPQAHGLDKNRLLSKFPESKRIFLSNTFANSDACPGTTRLVCSPECAPNRLPSAALCRHCLPRSSPRRQMDTTKPTDLLHDLLTKNGIRVLRKHF